MSKEENIQEELIKSKRELEKAEEEKEKLKKMEEEEN
jgi:hypothetical protein